MGSDILGRLSAPWHRQWANNYADQTGEHLISPVAGENSVESTFRGGTGEQEPGDRMKIEKGSLARRNCLGQRGNQFGFAYSDNFRCIGPEQPGGVQGLFQFRVAGAGRYRA